MKKKFELPIEVIDTWMKKLLPAEFKVFICLCRWEFFNPNGSKAISLVQICLETGCSMQTVVLTIKKFLKSGLIKKSGTEKSEIGRRISRYEIGQSLIEIRKG